MLNSPDDRPHGGGADIRNLDPRGTEVILWLPLAGPVQESSG